MKRTKPKRTSKFLTFGLFGSLDYVDCVETGIKTEYTEELSRTLFVGNWSYSARIS